MQRSAYKYFSVTIPAGEIRRVDVYSRFLTILNNSAASDPLVSIGGQSYERIPQGISIELPDDENFTYLEFYNDSAATLTITFAVSAGRIYDARFVASAILSVNATSNVLSTPAAIAVTTSAPASPAIAADSTRRAVMLQNNGSYPVWAGDSNVDGANNRGLCISPGEALTLESEAEIYLRSTGGASTISLVILQKV